MITGRGALGRHPRTRQASSRPPTGRLSARDRIRDNERADPRRGATSARRSLVLVCGADPKVRIAEARGPGRGGHRGRPARGTRPQGVRLAIEPLHPMYAGDRSVINTLERGQRPLRAVPRAPSLGVAVDVYHVWWDPELEAQIERAGRLGNLAAFHVCDWKTPSVDMLEDRGLMGEGCIDIPRIRGWVEAAGFRRLRRGRRSSRKRFWAMDQDDYLRHASWTAFTGARMSENASIGIIMNGVTGRMGTNQHLDPLAPGHPRAGRRARSRRRRHRARTGPGRPGRAKARRPWPRRTASCAWTHRPRRRARRPGQRGLLRLADHRRLRPAAIRKAIAAGKAVYTREAHRHRPWTRRSASTGDAEGRRGEERRRAGQALAAGPAEAQVPHRHGLLRPDPLGARRVRLLGLRRRSRSPRSGPPGTTARRRAAGSSSTCSATGGT
ncbi:MAG: sugar phosphate isomerase/epimerase [Chromatiales bacterium]|nr:sugar phosphate isomerase/epimerase [Chromatiales bacterium]